MLILSKIQWLLPFNVNSIEKIILKWLHFEFYTQTIQNDGLLLCIEFIMFKII